MHRVLFLFLFAMQINPVLATEIPFNGVWQGKVGDGNIVVCFNGDQNGSYYYSRHKIPIQLTRNEKDKTWDEQGKSGVWTLGALADGKLNGVWRDPKNKKTLTMSLTTPSNQNDDKPCASDEYNNILEIFPTLRIGKAEEFEGRKFRRLRIADVETIELLASDAAIKKVNRDLRSVLPKTRADLNEYYEKRRWFLGNMGLAAEDETYAEPHYWSTDWVSVRNYRWAAGHGNRGISLAYRTWNLRTGEEADLWQWFGTKSSDYDDTAQLPPQLKTFLFKHWKVDPECVEGYYGEGTYHATLEPTGVLFWEHAFGSGCEKEILIPYSELDPILTVKGKAAVASFLNKP